MPGPCGRASPGAAPSLCRRCWLPVNRAWVRAQPRPPSAARLEYVRRVPQDRHPRQGPHQHRRDHRLLQQPLRRTRRERGRLPGRAGAPGDDPRHERAIGQGAAVQASTATPTASSPAPNSSSSSTGCSSSPAAPTSWPSATSRKASPPPPHPPPRPSPPRARRHPRPAAGAFEDSHLVIPTPLASEARERDSVGTHMWTAPTCKRSAVRGSDRLRSYVRSVIAVAHDRCQDGFRDASSKQRSDLGCHWVPRSVSRLGIDRSRQLLLLEQAPAFPAGDCSCR